jgi:protein-tyrosine phosphatase
MAEVLCRSFLGRFQLQQEVEVASAGLDAADGGPAAREAAAVMAERGIDLSGHRTACLTADQVRWADLILTMEERQKLRLLEKFPEAADKAFVLKEYVTAPEAAAGSTPGQAGADRAVPGPADRAWYDIPDPFGQSTEVYHRCAAELASAVADICIDIHRRRQAREPSPGSGENRQRGFNPL